MKLISGLAAVALAATTLAPPLLSPAAAATPEEAADLAGDWIAAEAAAGAAAGDFTFYQGQLIDAGLALAAVGQTTEGQDVSDDLAPMLVSTAPNTYGYVKATEYDTWTDPEDPVLLQVGRYANPTAKAAAFAQRIGRDPRTAYADIDLLDQLEDLTDDTTGQLVDDSYFGDYANTIGQAFAVEALVNAESAEAGLATEVLLDRQCPAGFFPLDLRTDCPDTELHPDVTALAVISLVESGLTSAEVTAAIADAADWLESVQLADGSFPGDGGAAGANTNGTGLAGWALGAAGRTQSAAEAAIWTRRLQVADAGACASQAPNGAIAYNAADFASGRADGLGSKRATWRIASFQAAPLLQWAPAATGPLDITTPATAADGATVTAVVTGLGAGEHACVALGSDAVNVTGTGGDLTVDFTLPAGPGAYDVTVTTLTGEQRATTTVPAPATPTTAPTTMPTTAPTTMPTTVPSPAPAVAGQVDFAKVERVKRNRFRLGIACDGAAPCTGKVVVRTKRRVETAGGTMGKVVVARKSYSLAAGYKSAVVLKVRRAARPALRAGRLRVVARHQAAGTEPVRTAFWLKRA